MTHLRYLKAIFRKIALSFTDLRTENTRAILPMALILFLITSLRRLAAAPINIRDPIIAFVWQRDIST